MDFSKQINVFNGWVICSSGQASVGFSDSRVWFSCGCVVVAVPSLCYFSPAVRSELWLDRLCPTRPPEAAPDSAHAGSPAPDGSVRLVPNGVQHPPASESDHNIKIISQLYPNTHEIVFSSLVQRHTVCFVPVEGSVSWCVRSHSCTAPSSPARRQALVSERSPSLQISSLI